MVKAASRQSVPVRRADAERNIAAILAAGTRLLSSDPAASVAAIAKAAGVGRVTLYGHFPSREALVEAVLNHVIGAADPALEDPALETAPAPEAMAALLRSSWEILDQHRRLFVAADRTMATERIRRHHDRPLRRVERLIERGRRGGDFRTDLPLPWLVTTFFSLVHSAAQEREEGRLAPEDVERVLITSMLSLLTDGVSAFS
ncbi:Transcriptional regulator, TetR family [[Actinomadura] parvosata subsp. kistnae]|uniref:TetR family transcriptional regulator n=1 Tax=[Actinomadura] parvosata subsp. kistnae TaxID=1909395 RepID=A0A1U9ZYL8_9ACTN|nr:TetR/AcrR family transcriptional regulator [Nonomuraea sp. ATCC 55076]AQZ63056.1 TetR family transcriptional regulator [Nonomuraea sp. ATCC 55076]SPL98677.1 Transcriptional regulator, TetR family [Actinomadura parvosata subsp. kistnae]